MIAYGDTLNVSNAAELQRSNVLPMINNAKIKLFLVAPIGPQASAPLQ